MITKSSEKCNAKRLVRFQTCGRVGVAAILGALLISSSASAQQFEVKSIAEKKISQLPAGPLFWRIENFPTLAQAQAAAGPTALAAEASGKAWLFTLGAKGGSSPGGTKVAEVGPVPPSLRLSTYYELTALAVRQALKLRYTSILGPKASMC